MNETTKRLLARKIHIINGHLPNLSYQAKAATLDYAANAYNQQSCYTGNQYTEANVDFDKLYADMNKMFSRFVIPKIQVAHANLERIQKTLLSDYSRLDFARQFKQNFDVIHNIKPVLHNSLLNHKAFESVSSIRKADNALLHNLDLWRKSLGYLRYWDRGK